MRRPAADSPEDNVIRHRDPPLLTVGLAYNKKLELAARRARRKGPGSVIVLDNPFDHPPANNRADPTADAAALAEAFLCGKTAAPKAAQTRDSQRRAAGHDMNEPPSRLTIVDKFVNIP
jgi:hypothetical protein